MAAVQGNRSGAEVTFDATILAAPVRSGSHEHLIVTAPGGSRLEIDHNVSLATWVPAAGGDPVVVHGQLYIDSPTRVGVHCTHAKTSSGCPYPGWVEWRGSYYE
ncbi:MAG: hypothetical protein M3024_07975 [Candidatus Dormibacteraeota bacterium]|nr:hypothetical protein [Candidatus Dormibacteraeota bacterium]